MNNMQVVSKRWVLLLFAALAATMVLVAACGEEEEEGAATPGAEATAEATPGAEATPSGPTQGVTDTEIKVGTLLPLTGTAAPWGVDLSKGMQAYFDYINDQGGIYGRELKLYVEDNGYSGPVAHEAARKLVEQDKVFMIQGSLGTEAEMAVYKYLEEHNVIDAWTLTAARRLTDPVAHTRFVSLVDYQTEGRIFAKYIAENYDGKKVGLLIQNDDFGKEGEQGTKDGLQEEGANVDTVTEYFNVIEADMTAHVQRLRNEGVDLLVFWGGPTQAGSLLKVSRETLSWDVPIMMCSVTASIDIVAALGGYDNAEGVISAIYGRQGWEDIPIVNELKQILAEYAPDVEWNNTIYGGMLVSMGTVTTLKQAGPDLTVDSFVAAAESLCKYQYEYALAPSSMGPTDHRSAEAEMMARWEMDRSTDPPQPKLIAFGDVVDFESTTECVEPTPPAGYFDQPGPSLHPTPTPEAE
jgi:branched-chain amino acid transport system substrate-binding protein